MSEDNFVAIVGAGPAGLMAAEIIANAGIRVVVYDRKPSVGRKFLMAGRGGLNLTHSEDIASFLSRYREQEEFLTPLIKNFSPQDLRNWCEGLGQKTFIGSSGRVFPESMKASPLLRAWLSRLEKMGVEFSLQHTWKGWDENAHILFETNAGETKSVNPRAILLALGGASWPGLGSDGIWTTLLKNSGLSVSPLQPSNCGFSVEWSDFIKQHYAGQPLKNIALSYQQHTVQGEAVVSEKGIEGGAVYALSSILRETIHQSGMAKTHIDLRPTMNRELLIQKLQSPRGRKSFTTWLNKSLALPPLQIALLHENVKDIQAFPPEKLADLIKAIPLTLTATFDIERAISSAGGLCTKSVDEGMMIKSIPGVFAAGEMLDWEAPTGGYLLQACFATGHAAGCGILKYLSS